MAENALTDEVIAAAMRRAEKAVCPPLNDYCYGLAFNAAGVLADLSPKGWCTIGWAVRNSGREAWEAWYNVVTQERRLRKHSDVP